MACVIWDFKRRAPTRQSQYQGYLTLSATNYTGTQSSGLIAFTVNRVQRQLGNHFCAVCHHQWLGIERDELYRINQQAIME